MFDSGRCDPLLAHINHFFLSSPRQCQSVTPGVFDSTQLHSRTGLKESHPRASLLLRQSLEPEVEVLYRRSPAPLLLCPQRVNVHYSNQGTGGTSHAHLGTYSVSGPHQAKVFQSLWLGPHAQISEVKYSGIPT